MLSPMLLSAYDAVLFDLDGVLVATTEMHAACWKATFDPLLAERGQRPFDAGREYLDHVDGKPRSAGVRDFFRSRGVTLPEPAVEAIGERKQVLVQQALERDGVDAFPGSVRWIERLRRTGLSTAVVTSSANGDAVLRAAGISALFDLTVDGRYIARRGLRGKPAPDGFLAASGRLGVPPGRAVVVEDALAGVAAGRAGDFGLVIGVARHADDAELRAAGADLVVADLGELVP
jgi:alpha,alpha-trehalose phosphorylase